MLTEKRGLAIAKRLHKHQARLQAEYEDIKRRGVELAAKARQIAGPHGVIIDATTLEPLRAATEAEVAASIAAASADEPDFGPIALDGREVFALPLRMLE